MLRKAKNVKKSKPKLLVQLLPAEKKLLQRAVAILGRGGQATLLREAGLAHAKVIVETGKRPVVLSADELAERQTMSINAGVDAGGRAALSALQTSIEQHGRAHAAAMVDYLMKQYPQTEADTK